MKIGVDAGVLCVDDDRLKTGVYIMFLSLFKDLVKIDQTNEYILYTFYSLDKDLLKQFSENVKNVVVKQKKAWNYFALPLELIKKPVDLFLGPSQSLPFFGFKKSITIIHDIAFEYYPESFGKSASRLHWLTLNAAKRANKIISVSEQTKKDLIKTYNIDPKKIIVIYEGYQLKFKPQNIQAINKIRIKYKLPQKYFLFVGSLKKIKNVPNIIEGFANFQKQHNCDCKLVLVGSDLWLDKNIVQTIDRLKIKKQIINLGYIDHDELPMLYSGAIAFISPSIYEGFGLPLVEAMSCGTPVITSNRGAMKEVVGEAGLLVDPDDPKDIAESIILIYRNKQLRQELIKNGLTRAREFSWKKAAKILLNEINKFK